MTGLELVDCLRSIPGLEQSPLMLMSARLPPSGVEARGLSAIHKPFHFDALIRLLREQLPAADELLSSISAGPVRIYACKSSNKAVRYRLQEQSTSR